MNKIDLSGRFAVVTGGAQGFGRAITERFAASGAKVMIWDFDDTLAQNRHDIGAAASATRRPPIPSVDATAATLKAFGKIDISSTTFKTPRQQASDDLSHTEAPGDADHPDGPFICCKAVVPSMKKNNYGRIVNIASIAGKEGNPNASHYSASKAGVIALIIGKELATPPHRGECGDASRQNRDFDQMTQRHIDFMRRKFRARFKVEELASLAAWMASEECLYTTGAVFDISAPRDIDLASTSLEAGRRKAPPDDKLHEAIHLEIKSWIASSLTLLAMTGLIRVRMVPVKIALDLRVRHQDRCDQRDGGHAGDVPEETRLYSGVLEPQRDVFRRAAEQCVGNRISKTDAQGAHFRWKHLGFYQTADRGVERHDAQRGHNQGIGRIRALHGAGGIHQRHGA